MRLNFTDGNEDNALTELEERLDESYMDVVSIRKSQAEAILEAIKRIDDNLDQAVDALKDNGIPIPF